MAITVTLAVTIVAPAAGAGSPCADVVSIAPDESLAGWPGRPGESICYRVDVDSPGALLVGAVASGVGGTEPGLRLRERAGSVLVARCGTAHLALWIDQPGAYVFEVAAPDLRQELTEHTFTSRFVAEADAVTLETGGLAKDGDDDEIDPILNPVTVPPGSEPKDGDDDEIDPILTPSTAPQVQVQGDGLLLVDFGRRAVLVDAGERVVIAGSTKLRFYDLCHSDLSW